MKPVSPPVAARPIRDEASTSILNSVRVLAKILRDETAELDRATGLTIAERYVLQLIRRGGMSTGALAHAALANEISVSAVIERLVQRGLVQAPRAADDGDLEPLTVTEAGRALDDAAPPALQPHLFAALRALETDRLVLLDVALRQWLEELGHWNDRPPMFGESSPPDPTDSFTRQR